MKPDIADNLSRIEERIHLACERAGRNREEITLIAVSKTVPTDLIRIAYDLGVRDFGESRVQEAIPRFEALPKDIRWHFVGKLQSNKIKKIAPLGWVVHTLESQSQLTEIQKLEEPVQALIEVNIGEEPQKSGLLPEELPVFFESVLHCSNVHFLGLMAIGPQVDDPELMRPYFRKLKTLNDQLGGNWLSMGMSGDFEVAIQEGSTHIRVGTALFGVRSN